MNPRIVVQIILGAVSVLLLKSAAIAHPKDDGLAHVFTHSVVEAKGDFNAIQAKIQSDVVPMMAKAGGSLYAIWTPPTELPDPSHPALVRLEKFLKRPVKIPKLDGHQLIVMFAWPKDAVKSNELDAAMVGLDGVENVATRTFEPIYLANGLQIPTGRGYYVHRENRYARQDVPKVVQLSKEAWRTWEPYWGTQVTSLFRLQSNASQVQLLRIAWYPTAERWSEAKHASIEPESNRRFNERRKMGLEGARDAIATDRVVSNEEASATEARALVAEHLHLFNTTDAASISERTVAAPLQWNTENGHKVATTAKEVESFFSKVFKDFKERKQWVISVTNSLDIFVVRDGLAMAEYNFTRIRSDGSSIETKGCVYVLRKSDLGWRIIAIYTHDADKALSFGK